jgi:kynureninase
MFDEIGMDKMKRDKITCYLEYILEEISKEIEGSFEIITPTNPDERGCQLSVLLHGQGRSLFDYLMKMG